MVMFGLEFTGEVPFRQVYIHALVGCREAQDVEDARERRGPDGDGGEIRHRRAFSLVGRRRVPMWCSRRPPEGYQFANKI